VSLLMATLLHDIGMLSQKPEDLPDTGHEWANKSNWSDTATWVRVTHVIRLKKLAMRVITESGHSDFTHLPIFENIIDIAAAHQKWPWQWIGGWQSVPQNRAMAAILAVADLLDEDTGRCDTGTLVSHRDGSFLNFAHWLRHLLTSGRILVESGIIKIRLVRFQDTSDIIEPVYGALRNHFRLIRLYNSDLRSLNAQISNIELDPCTGIPLSIEHFAHNWSSIQGYSNEHALCYHLLRSFMPEALKDTRRCSNDTLNRIRPAGLEDIDINLLSECEGGIEPRSVDETTFAAITKGS